MASKKYLDGGGLAHLWDKIKSYLATWIADWKTTNFGTGMYSNSGSITIPSNIDVSFDSVAISTKIIKVDVVFSIGCRGSMTNSVTLETDHGMCFITGMVLTDLKVNLAEGIRINSSSLVFFYTADNDVRCVKSTEPLGLETRSVTLDTNGVSGLLVW